MKAALLTALVALPALADDVDTFIDQALKTIPELQAAQADAAAAQERVPQAQAWPDPMLQVGVQNDGFRRWQVGVNEMSWVSVMASQTIPFPGKTSGAVEAARVTQTKARVERVRLTVIAEVRRSVLALQLARARLSVLDASRKVAEQGIAIAKVKLESGEGTQADVLRATVELGRLMQQQRRLEFDAVTATQALNRLRGVKEEVGALRALALPSPTLAAPEPAPELDEAHASKLEAEAQLVLAGKAALPDLSVSAGVMVRGSLEPMWTVSVGAPVPVVGLGRRQHALEEARAMVSAAERRLEALTQQLDLATTRRQAELESLLQRHQLLTGLARDAESTTDAVLSQYRIGKTPFTSVLEANAARLSIADELLQVEADAWRLHIAHDERVSS
ncbi:MAG: TolC family protein [Archangium sp.]|nr:TolC family protein [Archangium sp.]